MDVCSVLFRSYLYICVCVYLKIQDPLRECRSIQSGVCGLTYYCAPLACGPDIIGVLAVWQHYKPKTKTIIEARLRDECLDLCTRLCTALVVPVQGDPQFFRSPARQCPRLNRTRSSMNVGAVEIIIDLPIGFPINNIISLCGCLSNWATGSGLTAAAAKVSYNGNTPGDPQTIPLRVHSFAPCTGLHKHTCFN